MTGTTMTGEVFEARNLFTNRTRRCSYRSFRPLRRSCLSRGHGFEEHLFHSLASSLIRKRGSADDYRKKKCFRLYHVAGKGDVTRAEVFSALLEKQSVSRTVPHWLVQTKNCLFSELGENKVPSQRCEMPSVLASVASPPICSIFLEYWVVG